MENSQEALFAEVLQSLRQIQYKQTNLEREITQTYKQLEALITLTTQIKFRAPLPPMRGWAISPDFATILFSHIQQYQPQTILELGGGISTLISGYALEQQQSGRLISVDHSEQFSGITQQNVAQHQISALIEFIHAPLTPLKLGGETWEWYRVESLASPLEIDLLVVDGPPQHENPQPMVRYLALPLFFKRLQQGAFILMDDADREDEVQVVDRWLEEYDISLVRNFDTEKGTKLLRKN